MLTKIFASAFLFYTVNASILDPVVENVVHLQASKPPADVSGVWKSRVFWKVRWLKEWKSSTVVKPVWRKVWGPVEIHEWVPVPKPPPDWSPNGTTPLLPTPSSWQPEPSWKPTDSQYLLNSYQTITEPPPTTEGYEYRNPESDLGTNESKYPNYPPYPVGSDDAESLRLPELPDFLEPPRINNRPGGFLEQSKLVAEYHIREGIHPQNVTKDERPVRVPLDLPVSPYATNLAQAVLQDKKNLSRNVTRLATGGTLTEVIFTNGTTTTQRPLTTTTTTTSSSFVLKTTKSPATTVSTERSPVFIVTPVTSG